MKMKVPFKYILLCCMCSITLYANAQRAAGKEGFITAGHLKVHYTEYGKGQPLFFIHAGYLDSRMWNKQVDFFSKYYRVILFDLPHHGETSGNDTTTLIADVFKTVMDSLHIAQASFVGLSMGSSTTTDFALAYPQRINKLVLVAPGLSGAFDILHVDSLSMRLFDSMDSAAATNNKERIAQNFADIWCVGPFRKKEDVDAGAYQYVYNTVLTGYDKHTNDSWPTYDPVRAAKRLAGFTKSTLLIEADADVPIIHDNATYIHQQVKNSRLVTIHGSAHMINLEKPNEFNKVVLSFLKEKN